MLSTRFAPRGELLTVVLQRVVGLVESRGCPFDDHIRRKTAARSGDLRARPRSRVDRVVVAVEVILGRVDVDRFEPDAGQFTASRFHRAAVVDNGQLVAVGVDLEDYGVVPDGIPFVPGHVISSLELTQIDDTLTPDFHLETVLRIYFPAKVKAHIAPASHFIAWDPITHSYLPHDRSEIPAIAQPKFVLELPTRRDERLS